MNNSLKSELIKKTKTKTKVDTKKLIQYLSEVEMKTGFEKWTNGREIKINESRTYQDIEIYNVVSIRFISETSEFLGFVQKYESLYDLIKNVKELSEFVDNFSQFLEKLTKNLDIKWNPREQASLNQVKWISDFIIRLGETSDNLLFHFKRKELYIKDCGISIKFGYSHNENGVEIEKINNFINIQVNRYDKSSIELLERTLEEKKIFEMIRSKGLSNVFTEKKIDKSLFDQVFTDRLGYGYHNVKERLLKYIDKAVPGPIFDVIYTTDLRVETIKSPYMSFDMKYYKCDIGYYFLDMANKQVIYKETREELFKHCINRIVLSELNTQYN